MIEISKVAQFLRRNGAPILQLFAISIAISIGAPFVIWFMVLVNARIEASVPWFVLVAITVSYIALRVCARWAKSNNIGRENAFYLTVGAFLISVVSVWFLTVIGGTPLVLLRLLGDDIPAPQGFQALASITRMSSAGPIEEAAVRGPIQFGLRPYFGPKSSEAIANVAFVALHALRAGELRELIFVSILAIVNGRISSKSGTVSCAAWNHALTNISIAAVVLFTRFQ